MPVIKVIKPLVVLISADRQRPPSECLSLLCHESVSCARAHWRLGDPPAASRDEPVLWPVARGPGARADRAAPLTRYDIGIDSKHTRPPARVVRVYISGVRFRWLTAAFNRSAVCQLAATRTRADGDRNAELADNEGSAKRNEAWHSPAHLRCLLHLRNLTTKRS
jgi:hypothetical protein